ncbi:MAG: hypothetical protein AAGA96_01110 [Verrucomicrobiota bacterium]
MKKFLTLAAVALGLFALAPTTAEAGYRSKIIGKCSKCGGPIHAYYKPVRLSCGSIRYTWVPSYHSTCRNSYRSYGSSSYHSSRYRGFTYSRPGFSIRIGPSYGYCR